MPPEDDERGRSTPSGDRRLSPGAWRITFEYDARGVRVVAQQRVQMLAPPDDSELMVGDSGYWIELRDASGEPLYRQILRAPIQTTREVFSPDPEEGMRHVDVPGPEGVFQAVVPALPDAREAIVYGRPDPRELSRSKRGARQLIKVRLRETSFPDRWPRP